MTTATLNADPVLARFRKALDDTYGNRNIERVVLFGSRARGDAGHAAEALLYECTGTFAKTHRGLRARFARIAKDEPRIDQSLTEFLGRAYELKSLADYGTGTEASTSVATANAAIESARLFVACIDGLPRPD